MPSNYIIREHKLEAFTKLMVESFTWRFSTVFL